MRQSIGFVSGEDHRIGTIGIEGSDAIPDVLSLVDIIGSEPVDALLAAIMKRGLRSYDLVLFMPVNAEDVQLEAREGSVLLDARLNGLTGGVLLSRKADGSWLVSTHT